MLVKNLEDIRADSSQFIFNLHTVFSDFLGLDIVSFRFLLLLNRGNDSPRSTTGTDHILVSDREQVSFFNRQFDTELFDKNEFESRFEAKQAVENAYSTTKAGKKRYVKELF